MNNDEQLKEIKDVVNKYEYSDNKEMAFKYATDLMQKHARYLVEQAERVKRLEKQNYYYREAIIEAMDLGLYGDSDDGITTMYNILNEALGKASDD